MWNWIWHSGIITHYDYDYVDYNLPGQAFQQIYNSPLDTDSGGFRGHHGLMAQAVKIHSYAINSI